MERPASRRSSGQGCGRSSRPGSSRPRRFARRIQFVESGNADAGLVGRSIVKVKGIHAVDVDRALYEPIIQGLGIVADSRRIKEAREFAAFVQGDDGQSVLAGFGFLPP